MGYRIWFVDKVKGKKYLKTIDTIVKTHDKKPIFSWDAFRMCSIDPTNSHNMLTGLSDKY